MKPIICALCSKLQKPVVLYPANFALADLNKQTYSARRIPDRIHYQLNKCLRCGLIFSSPIVPFHTISKLYKDSTITYDAQISYATKTYVSISTPFIQNGNTVIEIGCGSGFFLSAIKKIMPKTDVWGVEPSSQAVKLADKKIHMRHDIFKKNQFKENFFDAVCCFHTLDHMIDPFGAAREMFRITKPGGTVIIVVHDTDGLSVKLFGEKSPIFDVEHIFLFNKKTITDLFSPVGFTNIQVQPLKNTYPLSYWVRMSGLHTSIKIPLMNFLETIGIGKRSVSLAGGNMTLVATKPA
jgi:ubiquinone/menaquinone biosynthesis C-methylase UbiE